MILGQLSVTFDMFVFGNKDNNDGEEISNDQCFTVLY
jgi:hypothetical protein